MPATHGRNRQRSTPQQRFVFLPDPHGHGSLRPGGVPGASRLMWLKAIANTATGGVAMTSARTKRAELHAGRASVRDPATLRRTDFCAALEGAYVWKTGPRTRSFSSPRSARSRWPSARGHDSEPPALVRGLDRQTRSGTARLWSAGTVGAAPRSPWRKPDGLPAGSSRASSNASPPR